MSGKADPTEKRTITLKLSNASTVLTKIGQRTESPQHQVAGIGWHISAYPSVVDNVTYLSCFLVGANASRWFASVFATFRIFKKNGGLGKKSKLPQAEACGHRTAWRQMGELLSANSGYLVDDSVEIRVDFSVTDVCGASFNVFETVGALAADIKLKVGDSVFYANKGYLSVVSSVFRDMFALTEAAESKKEMDEIELKGLGPSEFKEFLGVVYPTRYPINDANVISLFRIADRFDVQLVIADCECYLMGANSVPCFDKLKLAVDLNRDHLKERLLSKMTCDDLQVINQNKKKGQLGMDVLEALFDKHIGVHHSQRW